MRTTSLCFVVAGLILVACSRGVLPLLNSSPEVLEPSKAGETLLNDLINAPGGVGFADWMHFPDAARRDIVRIEVLDPYTGTEPGEERWYIQHDGNEVRKYLVRLIPDGEGGTIFAISLVRAAGD